MTNLPTKPRWKLFLEALPRHDWKVEPSAIEAGYSPSYARTCQNLIMTSALRAQAKETLRTINTTSAPIGTQEGKATLAQFIGLNEQDVGKILKKIATNDKDYGSALKVVAPVIKEMGHNISVDDGSKVSVPILNVIVDKGPVEPLLEEPEDTKVLDIVPVDE